MVDIQDNSRGEPVFQHGFSSALDLGLADQIDQGHNEFLHLCSMRPSDCHAMVNVIDPSLKV